MTLPIYPDLPGLEYSVVRAPIFKTLKQESASGMETRAALQLYPRWQWTLSYSVLRANALNEFQTLIGFFLARRGSYETFLFLDPDDNAVTTQPIGVGDGSNKNFQLVRSYGGFTEPVLTPILTTIYVGGSALTSGQWDDLGGGAVHIHTAPGNTVAVTADIGFWWPVRFMADQYDFAKFMDRLWEQKKIDFISVKNL